MSEDETVLDVELGILGGQPKGVPLVEEVVFRVDSRSRYAGS